MDTEGVIESSMGNGSVRIPSYLTCPESALPQTYTNPAVSVATENSAPVLIIVINLLESLWSSLGDI